MSKKRFFAAAALFLIFSSCRSGPLLDPDVMDKKDLPSAQRTVYYLKISGTLEDESGAPVKGAKVVCQTSQGLWTDISTVHGNFRLEAIINQGETLDFHFTPATEERRPAAVNWTVRVFDNELPKGVNRVTLHFQAQAGGTIRLASVEY